MKSIQTKEKINAEVKVPASKSYTNRALLIAALADGKSILRNVLVSDDTKFMRNALEDMGVKIEDKGEDLVVHGTAGKLVAPKDELFVGNAGTAMRFLTAAISLADGNVVLTGNDRMKKRPIKDLVDGLGQLGVKIECSNGFPPINVSGGSLDGGKVKIKGDKSSQYFSSIMMSAPYAKNDVEIKVEGDLTSKSYIDITTDIMKKFGVIVENNDHKSFKIKAGQKYNAIEYEIEGDASSATYFFAAAAITKGKITVKGINPDSVQGDIGFSLVLEKMGCKVEVGKDSITIVGDELRGIDVDMNFMPDAVQTLAVVALFAKGETTIKNIANLRIKETDRIAALATELKKLGAKVEEGNDNLTIIPREYNGCSIDTYDDHRMAMSFALAGLKIDGVKINNPECVSKSFPTFWEVFEGL